MFRLRPTARQHIVLAACVESHRELYNAALQERRDAWAHSKTRINYGDQSPANRDPAGTPGCGDVVIFESAGHAAPVE